MVGENGSVDGIARGVKINHRGNAVRRIVRSPDIVAGGASGGVALAEEEGFEAQGIEQDIEWSGGHAVGAGVKVGARRGDQGSEHGAQRMSGIEARDDGVPGDEGAWVGLRGEACGVELAEQVVERGVGEADVGADEVLVEDGGAEEARELLLFGDFTREREDVAATGEDGAVDAAVEGRKENELAFVEGDFCVAAAEGDVMGGLDLINGSGVEAEIVEGVVEIVGWMRGGGLWEGSCGCGGRLDRRKSAAASLIEESVVIFGVAEQGGSVWRRLWS